MTQLVQRKFDIDMLVDDESIPNGSSNLVQVDACLSKINHRLYRQGRNYRVKVDLDPKLVAPNTRIDVYALRPTWFTQQAWKMAKKAYDEALELEKERLGADQLAKWRDFRVETGIASPIGTGNLWSVEGTAPHVYYPSAGGMLPVSFTSGMFEASAAENLDNGNRMIFSWGASDANTYSIIDEYDKTRAESDSPEFVIPDMPYEALDANAEDDDYIELQANGYQPPYAQESFAIGTDSTGVWMKVATLFTQEDGTTNMLTSPVKLSSGWFDAMCGSVVLNMYNPRDTGIISHCVSVEVAKGDYRGVKGDAL